MTYFQVFIAQYQMVSQLNNEHQTTNKMKKMKHSRTLPSIWDEVFDAYPFKGRSLQDGRNTPAVNIAEKETGYLIELSVPGFSKEEINIEVENDTLKISGERKNDKQEEKQGFSRREFNYSSFSRSFTIPSKKIDLENVQAEYEAGILSLNLPKAEKANWLKKIEVA